MPGGRLKVLRPPRFDGLGRLLLLSAEVLEVGLAVAAANFLQVKADVFRLGMIHSAQEIAAKLLARRAREPMTPPDFTHAVHARIAAGIDGRKLLQQFRLFAQGCFDRRHLGRRKGLVEIGLQVGLGDAGHAIISDCRFQISDLNWARLVPKSGIRNQFDASLYSSGKTSSDRSCLLIKVLSRAMK